MMSLGMGIYDTSVYIEGAGIQLQDHKHSTPVFFLSSHPTQNKECISQVAYTSLSTWMINWYLFIKNIIIILLL